MTRLVRAALLSLVVAGCAVEALTWARLGLVDLVRVQVPKPVVFEDGTAGFYRYVHDDVARERRLGVRVYDAAGTLLGEDFGSGELDGLSRRVQRAVQARGRLFSRLEGVDRTFETSARFRRELRVGDRRPVLIRPRRAIRLGVDGSDDAASLAGERGLLVVRTIRTGRPILAVGPDGPAVADDSAVARFDELVELERVRPSSDDGTFAWLESARNRLVIAKPRSIDTDPFVALDVAYVLLAPASPDAPPADSVRTWIAGDRLLVLDGANRLRADVALLPFESGREAVLGRPPDSDPSTWTRSVGLVALASTVPSGDPLASATRIRRQVFGKPIETWNLVWTPTDPAERTLAVAACVPAALRPLPLTIASFLSDSPSDQDAGASWWWRDPIVAGRKRPLALLACALVALACAWRARRVARTHCATTRGATAWTLAGAALGPLGLLLQRLLLVRAPAERVGEGMRSLALDTCPATRTPWPTPVRTGCEIIEGA